MKLTSLCLALFAVAACGGKTSSTGTTEPTGDQKLTWAQMDHEQRDQYMEKVVLPTMKAKFVAFNAEKYADMDCSTCHSAAAVQDHSFKMPNPDLMQLDFSKKPEDYSEEEQQTGHFMDTVVVPEMAKLLDEERFNPETQKGFGCLECHTMVSAQ